MIRLATSTDRARWNGYVERSPVASVYHRWEWLDLFAKVYGLSVVPLVALDGGRVTGVLPLVRVGAPGLGAKLVSMPFFGHGGAIADDDDTWRALVDAARDRLAEHRARHVELRHAHPVPAAGLAVRDDKLLMRLDLTPGEKGLFEAVGPKGRADIRRPEKEGITAHVGGVELVPEFHAAYADVMRSLGSPCHSRALFEAAHRAMDDRCFVVVARYQGVPVGGAFLVEMNGLVEVPCAGTLHRIARLRANMLLYWTAIREAVRRGNHTFSFGRSSEDSGTWAFKKNWGATSSPLPYHYALPEGATLPERAAESPVLQRVSAAWKQLPTAVTTRVGPRLARLLP